jgi:hypothetical protein
MGRGSPTENGVFQGVGIVQCRLYTKSAWAAFGFILLNLYIALQYSQNGYFSHHEAPAMTVTASPSA